MGCGEALLAERHVSTTASRRTTEKVWARDGGINGELT